MARVTRQRRGNGGSEPDESDASVEGAPLNSKRLHVPARNGEEDTDSPARRYNTRHAIKTQRKVVNVIFDSGKRLLQALTPARVADFVWGPERSQSMSPTSHVEPPRMPSANLNDVFDAAARDPLSPERGPEVRAGPDVPGTPSTRYPLGIVAMIVLLLLGGAVVFAWWPSLYTRSRSPVPPVVTSVVEEPAPPPASAEPHESVVDLFNSTLESALEQNRQLQLQLNSLKSKFAELESKLAASSVTQTEQVTNQRQLISSIVSQVSTSEHLEQSVRRWIGEAVKQQLQGMAVPVTEPALIPELANYAEASAGAVASLEVTGGFVARVKQVYSAFFAPDNGPMKMLDGTLTPGSCWAIANITGSAIISLPQVIDATAVTVEHIPRHLAHDVRSAPRSFSVSGLTEGEEREITCGTFVYDIEGPFRQIFKCERIVSASSFRLRIDSNWGHANFTCVYRFQLHK